MDIVSWIIIYVLICIVVLVLACYCLSCICSVCCMFLKNDDNKSDKEIQKRKTRQKLDPRNKKTNACFLLVILPFMPFVWLYHILFARRNGYLNQETIDGCCTVSLPLPRDTVPAVKEKKIESSMGMSWYLHSYAACLKKFGLIKFNYRKHMSVTEAIDRYVEASNVQTNVIVDPENANCNLNTEWDILLEEIKSNVFLYTIIEHLNRREPKYYFRILPSGSVREGFGHAEPSTSILASDYDLMLVPDGVFVYDEYTEQEDKFPCTFTAIDDENQNPERPTGYLWLKLQQNISVWNDLCYQRITNEGIHMFLSQLAVMELIEFRLGSDVFLNRLNRMLNEGYANEDEKFEVAAERTGPALNVKIRKSTMKMYCMGRQFLNNEIVSLDADFTLALSCPKFPRKGKYFFERRDRSDYPIFWPNHDVITRIHELGCHVVPKPSRKQLSSFQKEQMVDSYLGSAAVLEWRYSFSQAEMLLADNTPPIARICFLAFKATIKTHINCAVDDSGKQHKIVSYVLKTILFFEIEKCPPEYWEGSNVKEHFFLALLASLREKVVHRWCPHYWIEWQNLLVDIEEADQNFIIPLLDKIKQNPKDFIANEWLEWNRMIRENCCASCIDEAHYDRRVEKHDSIEDSQSCFCSFPIRKCKCCCPYSGIQFDSKAFEVY